MTKKIKLKTEISRILISKENKFYGKIDEKSILKGFRVNNKTYYQPFPIKSYAHATICEVSLILGDPKNCKYKMVKTDETTIVEDNNWVYISTKSGETVTTRCGQKVNHYIVPTSGIIVYPIGCSIYNKKFEINAILNINGKIISQEPKVIDEAIIENEKVSEHLEKLPNNTNLTPIISNRHYHILYINTYLLWAIAGTGTTLVILIYIKYYKNAIFKNHRSRKVNSEPQEEAETEELRLE